MKLIPRSEFAKTTSDPNVIARYNELLSRDLDIEMFISTDGNRYKILFNGFNVEQRGYSTLLCYDEFSIAGLEHGEWEFNDKTVADLIHLNPQLTDGAIDYIYVE